MNKPTVGRALHYYPKVATVMGSPFAGFPWPATVAHVFGDDRVNISLVDPNGIPQMSPPNAVKLLGEGEERPIEGGFCEWAPRDGEQDAAEPTIPPAAVETPAAETGEAEAEPQTAVGS